MAGKPWTTHRIHCCDPEALAGTLPKGLKGVPEDTLGEASTVLNVKVPQFPHRLCSEYWDWCKRQNVLEVSVKSAVV